ncbi:MAG: thymidine phosphorylase family protein [Nanoarchaeota archaeon]|nr:thymidine phosphorylase family protein [Nanoarchaeota archaeon]
MELKVKTSNWAAGIPVAILHRKTAESMGIHPGDRILIKTISKKYKQMATIIDTMEKGIKKGELGISLEIKKRVGLREGQKIRISHSQTPQSIYYIKKKLSGETLKPKEINEIIKDVVINTLSEPEIAMFISAMYKNGMNFKETTDLIDAILYSGKRLVFKNKFVVDKHCIGGVAGNRTTPLIVSICAAAGLIMPKTSSRAITSAAGTADTMEVLTNVDVSGEDVKKIVKKIGCCLTWGGSMGMVPADSKIIKVEKMLKIDPEAQLLASIMSKKLAVGSKYLLIDIPYGKNAKVTKSKALRLKKKFEGLAKHFGIKIQVVLTSAKEPIGNGIGPALEMRDIVKILNPIKKGPLDLEKKSLYLSGILLEMTKKAKKGKGYFIAKEILDSGQAWKKFIQIIKAQGGEIKEIIPSKISKDIFAKKSGKIKKVNNKLINELSRVAGAPIDKYAGVYLYQHCSCKIEKGEKILTIYAESKARLEEALKFYERHLPIKI